MQYQIDYFHADAEVSQDGRAYHLNQEDLKDLMTDYWHGENDPSTWLCASAVTRIRSKWPELSRVNVMSLASLLLGIDIPRLEHALDWHAHYLAWHDALDEKVTHVFPSDNI